MILHVVMLSSARKPSSELFQLNRGLSNDFRTWLNIVALRLNRGLSNDSRNWFNFVTLDRGLSKDFRTWITDGFGASRFEQVVES